MTEEEDKRKGIAGAVLGAAARSESGKAPQTQLDQGASKKIDRQALKKKVKDKPFVGYSSLKTYEHKTLFFTKPMESLFDDMLAISRNCGGLTIVVDKPGTGKSVCVNAFARHPKGPKRFLFVSAPTWGDVQHRYKQLALSLKMSETIHPADLALRVADALEDEKPPQTKRNLPFLSRIWMKTPCWETAAE